MDFEPQTFDVLAGVIRWVIVVGVVAVIALFVGLAVAAVAMGNKGPTFFAKQIGRLFGEVAGLSLQRIGALGSLTIKESLRRKALWIFAVFALLFMFAGWFLGSSESAAAQPYVAFVLMVVKYLTIPLAVMLSCWGLPADIKARSLHTVVTKPVHRAEVVIGRMLGYAVVTGSVVVVMGVIGLIWIARQVPDRAQDQLISRVPVYADDLNYLDRFGNLSETGINVGDVWDYRGFVEGNSKSQATFEFRDLDLADLKATILSLPEDEQALRLEYGFEVFRSFKGDVGEDVLKNRATRAVGVTAQIGFHNPSNPASSIAVPLVRYPELPFEIEEFKDGADESLLEVPLTIVTTDADGNRLEYDLFDDLAFDSDDDGVNDALNISVRCIDRQQYLGVALRDLFIRQPDRPFWIGYAKAIGGVLLSAILIIVLGTTASTFVKGPVATLATVGLIVLGSAGARNFADEYLGEFVSDGKVTGGGLIESTFRLSTQASLATPMDDTTGVKVMEKIDNSFLRILRIAFSVAPDFRPFDMAPYVSNGFDVPFNETFLPSIFTVLAFFIPCVVIGYFSLQLRELEAK